VSKVVVIDIGSGSMVPTCRRTAEGVAKMFSGGYLIRINPREPTLDATRGLAAPWPAEAFLAAVARALGPRG